MTVAPRFQGDVEAILATRHDNGADHWATPEGGIAKGGPFSTLEAPLLLVELGTDPSAQVLQEAAGVIWRTWREDGRFRVVPSGTPYPCQTIHAARTLAALGHATDPRLRRTVDQLLSTRHTDGGWRCAKFFYGRGPETDASNPGPTLEAIDALRIAGLAHLAPPSAIELLLGHWVTRAPLGPCHYGIGTLFLQVGYPFAGYNLFHWVHALSYYEQARVDRRFGEALDVLASTLVDEQVVVERVHRKLAGMTFCRKGEPSELGTARYREILANVDRG